MNKGSRYISAFTIFEVAVTMVITAIILMVVYQIFGVARQQMMAYVRMQDSIITYEQFTSQFSIDVQSARYIKKMDNTTVELTIENEKVTYAFAKNYLLRKGSEIDTLAVIVKSMKLDTIKSETRMNLSIHLEGDLLGETLDIYETREIDASRRINEDFL